MCIRDRNHPAAGRNRSFFNCRTPAGFLFWVDEDRSFEARVDPTYTIVASANLIMPMPHLVNLAKSMFSRVVLCLVCITVVAVPLIGAQENAASPAGVAWGVKGTWLVEGKGVPIHTGDSIQPGSLLRPDPVAAQHTIIVLPVSYTHLDVYKRQIADHQCDRH